MNEKKFENIVTYLSGLYDGGVVSIYREFCESTNNQDDVVYDMGDFDEVLGGNSVEFPPSWIARKIHWGNFTPTDDYFWFDGYGNLESFSHWGEKTSPIILDEIARYCMENDDDLLCPAIREILDEEENEEEGE